MDGLELFTLKEARSFDHHEHVVLARWEAAVDLLVLAELGRVGAEELGEAVVHLEAHHAEDREHGQHDDQAERNPWRPERDEAEPFQPEREGERSPRLAAACH